MKVFHLAAPQLCRLIAWGKFAQARKCLRKEKRRLKKQPAMTRRKEVTRAVMKRKLLRALLKSRSVR